MMANVIPSSHERRSESLPSDLAAAHAMILTERAARFASGGGCGERQSRGVGARRIGPATKRIAHLRLEIEKLRRELYGSRSERKARLLEQMELQLEDLEAAATEDELLAEKAAADAQTARRPSVNALCENPFPIICRVSAW